MIGRERPAKKYRGTPNLAEAESIAAGALAFLAEDEARLMAFMDATGIEPDTLRANAGSPDILEAALGYLVADEGALLAFAAGADVPPERVGPCFDVLVHRPR